jgi:DNA-binding response OmpR family regulator
MRLLVVEDEHAIADSIKKGLEHEAYAVDVAYEGTTGYDLAASEEYDAIILDLMLPGMNGIEICKKLREEKIHTPILILTAKGMLDDRVGGLNAGADDYLVKPFAFRELLARTKALTRRPHDTLSPILKYEDLTLDTVSYEVKRSNKTIPLSQKEYALLEYLLRNPNKIVSRDQIIRNVWNYDSDVLPNIVDVYIRYLRNKVDEPFITNPLIHTVRGFGYKLGEATK